LDARPPIAVQTRAVVARTAPPSPPPTVEGRERAIQANGGKPLSPSQVRQIQASEISTKPPVRIAPAATPVLHTASPPPTTPPAAAVNRPPVAAVHPNELPPVPKPASPAVANSALEREHLQQQLQMGAQQEQARQRVQQQQEQAHQQLLRQQADEARKQQLEQQHQQQTQQLAQQHAQAQAQLQKRQQQERQAQENQTKAASRKSDHPPNPR
jgi:hypothetical protein